MSKSAFFAILAAAGVLAAPAPAAQAATVLSVTPDKQCGPTSCLRPTKGFGQTFSAADFGGGQTISALAIDRRVIGDMQDHIIRISFQLADGSSVGSWGSYLFAVLGGDVLTVRGPPLDWSAPLGDLTVRLDVLTLRGGGWPYAGIGNWDGFPGQGAGGPPENPRVPDFAIRRLAPGLEEALIVPEPKAWTMMVLGFMGAGAILRRRRIRPVVRAQPCG